MSQELARQLLIEEGGKATIDELKELAKKRYPDRTLHNYLTDRFQSLSKKGFVTSVDGCKKTWKITQKGRSTEAGNIPIQKLDNDNSIDELDQYEISISNIVAGFDLDNGLDLEHISENHRQIQYHPESNNRLNYTPFNDRSLKIIATSTGRISIVGAKSVKELIKARDIFLDLLEKEYSKSPEIVVQNIVGTTSLDRELDLKEVSTSKEELFEYSPENFTGLIFRSRNGATILIYTSGKCIINGANTYSQIVNSYKELIEVFQNMGIDNVGV